MENEGDPEFRIPLVLYAGFVPEERTLQQSNQAIFT